MKKLLPWISRHPITNGQRALLNKLGYDGEERTEVLFGSHPVEDLEKAGLLPPQVIGVVAPAYVILQLVQVGFTVLEFVNAPSARQRGVFLCKGAWKYSLSRGELFMEYFPCPISLEKQEEGSLAPPSRKERK